MKDNPTPLIRQGWLRALVFLLVFFAAAVTIGTIVVLLMTASKEKSTGTSLINQDFVVIFLSALVGIGLSAGFRKLVDRRSIVSMGFPWKNHQQDGYIGFLLGPALLGLG